MQPLLTVLADGTERRFSHVLPTLADEFNLTDDERAQLLPSGRQETFRNRVHWASFYLMKAGLVERPHRGHLRVTARGLEALRQATPVNTAYLRQFPEFREFTQTGARDAGVGSTPPDSNVPQQTPEEQLEAGYVRHRASLASDLLAKLRECSPQYFEQVVVDLLVAMGYGGSRRDAGRAVGRAGDGGIDGIIKEDHLGLDGIYVQAKRWEASVGRPVVQAFAGSLKGTALGKVSSSPPPTSPPMPGIM